MALTVIRGLEPMIDKIVRNKMMSLKIPYS